MRKLLLLIAMVMFSGCHPHAKTAPTQITIQVSDPKLTPEGALALFHAGLIDKNTLQWIAVVRQYSCCVYPELCWNDSCSMHAPCRCIPPP